MVFVHLALFLVGGIWVWLVKFRLVILFMVFKCYVSIKFGLSFFMFLKCYVLIKFGFLFVFKSYVKFQFKISFSFSAWSFDLKSNENCWFHH